VVEEPKNGRLANPFGKATIFNQMHRHSRPVAPAGCTGWHLYLLTCCRETQMHRPTKQGGGGPPQPGPPPHPGPPQPRPPCQPPPPPCQPPPRPPPQPADCAWWTTPGAACGVGAAFATRYVPDASPAIEFCCATWLIAGDPTESECRAQATPTPQSARRPRRVLVISSRRSSIVIESPRGACTRK
jgi:hypothetical protein